jgi:tRNA(fMet)-specific endonuclease VapC
MNYVLDTNILLIYLREERTKSFIEAEYDPMGKNNNPIISIVTVGEIRSIAKRNYWGPKKIRAVEGLMNKLIITDIKYEDVIEKYAEIDAYSQDKIKEKRLGLSARNMGKNDLWIAATTAITNSKLITSDSDFDHLNNQYFELVKIKIIK